MATAVNEQNNRLWERLETHVQTQLTTIRPAQPLPMISVTGPQRQNTVWWEYFHKRMLFLKKKYNATYTDSSVIFFKFGAFSRTFDDRFVYITLYVYKHWQITSPPLPSFEMNSQMLNIQSVHQTWLTMEQTKR